jgi:hypothetical protein
MSNENNSTALEKMASALIDVSTIAEVLWIVLSTTALVRRFLRAFSPVDRNKDKKETRRGAV